VTGQRWIVQDSGSGVVLAELHGSSFSRVAAARLAQRIAEAAGASQVSVSLRTSPVPNPTLAHHGQARRAAWHITGLHHQPIGELYFGTPTTARTVGRALSRILAMPVKMWENTEYGSPPLEQHSGFVAANRRRTGAKRKGPKTRRYRTEKSFRAALAKFTASGELVDWYGDDHGWVIRLKTLANPSRSKAARARRKRGRVVTADLSRRTKRAGVRYQRRDIPAAQLAYYAHQGAGRLVRRGFHGRATPNPKGRKVRADSLSVGDVVMPPDRELSLWMRKRAAEKGMPTDELGIMLTDIHEGAPDKRGRWIVFTGYLRDRWYEDRPGRRQSPFTFKARPNTPWSLVARPTANPPPTPRRQRRAVASGRFAKARHYAASTITRGVRHLDTQRRAAGRGRIRLNPARPVGAGVIERLRAELDDREAQRWTAEGFTHQRDPVTVKERRDFWALDIGSSGAFMVRKSDGAVFGIKGYGTPDYRKGIGFADDMTGYELAEWRFRRGPFRTDMKTPRPNPRGRKLGGQNDAQGNAGRRSQGTARAGGASRGRDAAGRYLGHGMVAARRARGAGAARGVSRARLGFNPKGREGDAMTEIVRRAIVHTVVDLGQLQPHETRELAAAVRRGWLEKGKGGPFPKIKTVYAVRGYPFAEARRHTIDEMMALPNPKGRFTVRKIEDVVHSASVGDYTQAVFEVVESSTGKVVMRSYNQRDARTEAAYRNKHDPRGAFTRSRVDHPSPNRRRMRLNGLAARVRRKANRNPRESELARARRTFRRLNETDPGKLTRERGARNAPRVAVKLGELVSFRYRSDKYAGSKDNPHGKTMLYEHTTRRPRPVLATDSGGREVHIVGGRMHPTPDGLVN
jgi:hypothetical protein